MQVLFRYLVNPSTHPRPKSWVMNLGLVGALSVSQGNGWPLTNPEDEKSAMFSLRYLMKAKGHRHRMVLAMRIVSAIHCYWLESLKLRLQELSLSGAQL